MFVCVFVILMLQKTHNCHNGHHIEVLEFLNYLQLILNIKQMHSHTVNVTV